MLASISGEPQWNARTLFIVLVATNKSPAVTFAFPFHPSHNHKYSHTCLLVDNKCNTTSTKQTWHIPQCSKELGINQVNALMGWQCLPIHVGQSYQYCTHDQSGVHYGHSIQYILHSTAYSRLYIHMATLAVRIALCLITALISIFCTREQQHELHDVSAFLASQLLEQKHQPAFN